LDKYLDPLQNKIELPNLKELKVINYEEFVL